jgi:hypothetical protein
MIAMMRYEGNLLPDRLLQHSLCINCRYLYCIVLATPFFFFFFLFYQTNDAGPLWVLQEHLANRVFDFHHKHVLNGALAEQKTGDGVLSVF